MVNTAGLNDLGKHISLLLLDFNLQVLTTVEIQRIDLFFGKHLDVFDQKTSLLRNLVILVLLCLVKSFITLSRECLGF